MMKNIMYAIAVGMLIGLWMVFTPKASGQVQTCVWPHTCNK